MTDVKRNGSGKIYCHLCRCYERYPRQVLWNISSSMHCYETRFGGKCAAEVTLPSANQKNNHCEEPRSCQPKQLASCEQPTGETGHHLRSRSHFWPQAGLVATTAEEKAPDSSSHPQPARTTRDAEETVSHLATGTPARKRKRLTAEEKLIEDNKAYYKLEMKNNKLRSSGYFVTSRSSFEMGHAFVKEAEVSPVNISKQYSGLVNCSGGHKNNYDQKNFEHKNIEQKISSECVTKDNQGDESERCRLRSCRKPESDCSNSLDNIENSINHNESGVIDNDQGKSSSCETKNNNLHKNSIDNKSTIRKAIDGGKETDSQCFTVNECKETEEKNDSSNKQASCESEEQRESKTESSGSGPSRTRIRLSELSLLSNEAENFMFGEPVKKVSSDESSDDECVALKLKIVKKSNNGDTKAKWKAKRAVGRKKGRRIYRKVHRKVKVTTRKTKNGITSRGRKRRLASVHQFDDSSLGSADACSVGSTSDANTLSGRHRKRRTHAEAFIHDNLDYYKFEIPGSRLRFQGSVLPQMNISETQGSETDSNYNKKSSENSHTCDSNKENSLNSSDSQLVQFNVKSLEAIRKGLNDKLNAENEVKNTPEAIVETGVKKEESSDKKNGNELATKDLSLDRLRFSFEAAPQGEPWYQTYQRQDTGNEIYLSCPIDTSFWKSFLLPYEMSPTELAAAAASSNLPSCTRSIDAPVSFRKKKKRFAHLLDKKPRKSPRCHASTLAILSSLMHFRKRKEPDKFKEDTPPVKDDGPSSSDDVVNEDVQNKDERSNTSFLGEMSTVEGPSELKKDFSELAQNIDEMLESFPESSGSCISASPRNTNDNSEVKLRTPRSSRVICKKQSKSQREKFSKKLNQLPLRESDLIDIDHSVLASLATMSKDTIDCIPKAETCSRGGPTVDVVSLLSNITDCHCPGPPVSSKDCLRCGVDIFCPAMREMSCNSSECGASSTCDTIAYSDVPEGRQGIRGKRRKRKKNRTGWPVDKQKFRRKFYLRFKKSNENIPVQHSDNVHKHDGEDLCKPTESEVPLDVSINAGCSGSLGIDTEVQKYPDKAEKIEVPEPLERIEEDGMHSTCTPLGNSVSKGDLVSSALVSSESSQSDKKTDKDPSENVPVTYNVRHEKHSRLLRTGSLDSSTCSELKPCVKVKRIPNLAEYQIVPTIKIGISNRRLRSASSSSLTYTPVTKMDFVDDSIKDDTVNNRRSCRKKRPKFSDSWDTWLTPNRR
ncbi:uncharacterized protein LOC126176938 isoform X1 [Schistocerca cancellata]|uniref:uncharacterized protein LOC126176938 isoform X1 n=1 Tax=Schistocerca cancellata TaxID=274614 RepID=UPI002117E528|nr:uncharacterized protein LOC126176938 isoform X1 [Schistocerca cancellata]XP_049780092.1 uncharacterized protein LOC126176938 isoform X1 [Schistocerca cancellata]